MKSSYLKQVRETRSYSRAINNVQTTNQKQEIVNRNKKKELKIVHEREKKQMVEILSLMLDEFD